ncbi:hypothetical protein MYW48_23110 [Bacillus cereus]|uniref:hypothetical protein n=1 Tax=Bacillus cereus TaxID=1396 RepID=UPI001FFDA558|nr:hypothetical protein [Bacillus cereus]UPJ15582.1 hypothetical protein MYW48_23110 [Bacillus cereus]
MVKYVVLEDFTDLQDDNHVYRQGDHYPRKGQGKKKRIEELSGSENLRGEPLIKELEGNE